MTTPPLPPTPGWNEPIPLGQGPEPVRWQNSTSVEGTPLPPVDQTERTVLWPFITGLLVVLAGITVAVLIGAAHSTTPNTSVPVNASTSTTTETAVVVVRTVATTKTATAQDGATPETTEKQADNPTTTATSGP